MIPTALVALADVSMKLSLAGALVWWATHRAGTRTAAAAHRAWGLLLAGFVALPLAQAAANPFWRVVPSPFSAPAVAAGTGLVASGRMLLTVYALVAGALLVRLAFEVFAVRQLTRQSLAVDPASEPAFPRDVECAGLQFRETPAVGAPATTGTLRPCIFLPAGWRELDGAVLRGALTHELAHVRRHDYAVTIAARVLSAVFWFHPVVWIAGARLRWFAELACDAAASRAAGTTSYAAALVAFARMNLDAPPLVLGAGSQLPRRVDLLLTGDRSRSHRHWVAFVALALLAAAVTIRLDLRGPRSAESLSGIHASLHTARHRH